MKKQLINGREMEVMKILWANEEALTASQISANDSELSINTIHAVLKTLLKKEFIEIAEIVYSGTVLTRSYRTTITTAQYVKLCFYNNSTTEAIASLIEDESAESIKELEKILENKRKELEGK